MVFSNQSRLLPIKFLWQKSRNSCKLLCQNANYSLGNYPVMHKHVAVYVFCIMHRT